MKRALLAPGGGSTMWLRRLTSECVVRCNGLEELYDLETDPNEFRNRINDPMLAATAQKLRSRLPQDPAPARTPPKDSKYNRKR